MQRETISVNARAQWRLYILNHVLAGESSVTDAAGYLGLSVRSVRRLLARYRAGGVAALVHGNAGRVPANRLEPDQRARLVELAVTRYAGVNRAHLADLLAEREGITVPARTLRRILAGAGLPAVRSRRPRGHRARRDRMSQAGLLVQVDGSRHDWLEGRGPWLTLVGGIDDATGIVTGAVFREQEDTAGYLTVLAATADRYGVPVGLYSDRHGIFWKSRGAGVPSLAEQFAGRRSTTQLGRALEAAGIAWIAARSPQAKGRVERLWGTLQDRLRSELRLADAATLEEANVVLAGYVARHNSRFAVPPADPASAWRTPDRPVEALFCFRHPRRLAGDGTFTLGGREYMVTGRTGRGARSRPVVVEERLDGSLWVELDGAAVAAVPAPPPPVVLRSAPPPRSVTRPPTPAADHPWRRYPAVRPR